MTRDKALLRISHHSLGSLGRKSLQVATLCLPSENHYVQCRRGEQSLSLCVSYTVLGRPGTNEGKSLLDLGCCQLTPKLINLGRVTASHTRSVNLLMGPLGVTHSCPLHRWEG